MKLFIKKIFVFLAILLLMICPIFLLFVNHQSNLSSSYKIKSEVAIIYLGDSHIQNAVNDRLIPKSMNLGKDSESFYFSLFRSNIYRFLRIQSIFADQNILLALFFNLQFGHIEFQ